jgi:hypothetical protein
VTDLAVGRDRQNDGSVFARTAALGADCGLSTDKPFSCIMLVVEMKKISRNMMMSMSGIRFSSVDSSGAHLMGSAIVRRNLMRRWIVRESW